MEVAEASPTVVAPRRPRRLRYVVAGGLCAAAVIFLLVGGLSRNIVYFRTVSEAVQEHRDEPGNSGRLRMAGNVVTGSVVPQEGGVSFKVAEGGETVSVVHKGDPGELFKDGAPVVCEGRFATGATGETLLFESDRIMIKHGAEYRPPAPGAETQQ
ncbi:MAG TPA: cytochrome c maturation protein CcmE [Acidimicrobiia bacterium]|nr:cytochrome c maturation protein CcmE [Acidimicrobiia bacterium]